MRTISFISANYVGRALDYQGPAEWGPNAQATIRDSTAEHVQQVAGDVSAAGFKAIDIWTAHCDWQKHDDHHLEQVKGICAAAGLEITSYAGGIGISGPNDLEAPFDFMKRLGAPMFAGGIGGVPDVELAPMVEDACQRHGVRWAFENHPQKTTEEILSKIGNGKFEHCGVALDTGWCGSMGLDAVEATKRLRENLFILHLKDITEPGGHDTCALGDGVVPVEAVVRFLVESDWHGTICIEHEPYDRDPMPEVVRSRERVQQWLS